MHDMRSVCLRKLGGNRAGEVSFGRWLRNSKVTIEKLKNHTIEKTSKLTEQMDHILAIQDTTEINYQSHMDKVKGLGTVGNGVDAGFFLHPMLAIDANSNACLGLSSVHHWIRTKGKSPEYQKQKIEEKESYRWLETAMLTKQTLNKVKKVTIIADRESDIYEEWVRIPDEKTYLLTRACKDRLLEGVNSKLFSYTDELEVKGIYELKLAAVPGKRKKRKTDIEVRFSSVKLKRPKCCTDKDAPPSVAVYVVDVREIKEKVPEGEEGVHWRLLTTHVVDSVDNAIKIVQWYCQRWHIEQLFRTLKRQGLDVESSQVENGESLIKLVLLALQVSVQSMQLTLGRDGENGRPATDVFDENEIIFLSVLQPLLEGKTEKQKNKCEKNSLAWAAWIIGRLGGWKGYKSESPPGPITMSNGLKEFSSRYWGWSIAQKNVCID